MPLPPLNPALEFLLNAEASVLTWLSFWCLVIVVAEHFLGKFLEKKKMNLLNSIFSWIAGAVAIVGVLVAVIAGLNYSQVNWLQFVPNFLR